MRIICLDDFEYGAGSVVFTIYLENDSQSFPNSQWTDFGIEVLYYWIENILENYQAKKTKFTLLFFDGPYYIECFKSGPLIHMRCIQERKRKVTVNEFVAEIDDFVGEVCAAAYKTIELVERSNYGSVHKLNELKRSIEILEKAHINRKA